MRVALWALAMLALGSACKTSSDTLVARRSDQHVMLQPYPAGRWRLDTSQIGNVVLWVSQILIRHDQITGLDPCFNLAEWHSSLPLQHRTREDALSLAQRIAVMAQSAPERFGELARMYTEDICTKERGGSLGGIPASHLQPWPGVLDALSAIAPGQVSQVVETSYGFHIFYRRHEAPEAIVSGRRIVIAHDEAGWIGVLPRGEIPKRSRVEALALARSISQRATLDPLGFADLVAQYSEHGDFVRGGDIGSWSTREPTDYPREVEELSKLSVNQISSPLDSPVGFEVLQRTENHPRRTFAAEQIRVPFVPGLSSSDFNSEARALATARMLIDEVQQRPERFKELQDEQGGQLRQQWVDGRGSPLLTNAVEQLETGSIGLEPVRLRDSYVVIRRLAPEPTRSFKILYDLPQPLKPNIGFLLRIHGPEFAVAELTAVAGEAEGSLDLDAGRGQLLRNLHQNRENFSKMQPWDIDNPVYQSFLSQVERLLSAEQYRKYLQLLDTHFERLLLDRPLSG